MPKTSSHLGAQEAYALWIAGFALLCFTVAQMARSGGPKMRIPRPSGAQLSTILAWLIIAAVAAIVVLRHQG